MSEKAVTDILGSPSISVEFDPMNVPPMLRHLNISVRRTPVAGDTITYRTWEEGDKVFAATIQDGKVANRTAYSKAEMAQEKMTWVRAVIRVGMTRAEVEARLGPGKADPKIQGFTGEILAWESDVGIITVCLTNDKVALPAEFKDK